MAIYSHLNLKTGLEPGLDLKSHVERPLEVETWLKMIFSTFSNRLEVRRIVFDLLLVYKIIHWLVDLDFDILFRYNSSSTRGHEWKLAVNYSRLNCRKFFFANRIVNIWNSLDPFIVNAESLNIFKSRVYNIDLTPYCKGSCYKWFFLKYYTIHAKSLSL